MSTHESQTLGRRIHEALILATLDRLPMHGYQIALEIEQRSGGYFSFNHGTLYPILHKLEAEGMLVSDWSGPREGRARKEYAVTEAGRAHLQELTRDWRVLERELNSVLGNRGSQDEQVRTSAA